MFFYAMFLYGFFKLSNYAYYLLPGPDDQLWDHFLGWIVVVMVFKLISLYVKIYIQCTADYYLLDREKSDVSVHRVIRELKTPNENAAKVEYNKRDDVEEELQGLNRSIEVDLKSQFRAPIGWRSLFVCNELNELQMY